MQIFRLVILLLALMTPWPCAAMRVEMFDAMSVEDQREYVAFMSKRAQEILIHEGRRDLAERINQLFRKRRGEKQSAGEAQFHNHLAGIRSYAAIQNASHVKVQFFGGDVGFAFLSTLAGNQFQMPSRFPGTFSRSLREKPFWPTRPLRQP